MMCPNTDWLYSTNLACECKVKLPSHHSLFPFGLFVYLKCFFAKAKSDLRKHGSHTQLRLQPVQSQHYSQQKAKCAVGLRGPLRPKNNLTHIVSFSQSLRGQRRANIPVIKTQTGLSLSLLSSPSPAPHQPQGLTAPNTRGDRISPQTSKHNMKIKHT